MQFNTHRAQYEREAKGYVWLHSGVPPVIRPGLSIITKQEQPWHPRPFLFGPLGFVVDTTVRPEDRWYTNTQEQPWHPQPYTLPALVQLGIPPIFGAPETRDLSTVQEQPWHPKPSFQAGVQGPNVASGIGNILMRQELPWHPLPYVLRHTQFQPAQKHGTRVITRQQDPWHPRPFVLPHRQYNAPPVTQSIFPKLFIRQEYPGLHPKPFVWRQFDYTNQFPIQSSFPRVIENLTNAMLAFQEVSVSGGVFYTDSAEVLTQVDRFHQQYDPTGWMSTGGNISPRSLIGLRPYAKGRINNG